MVVYKKQLETPPMMGLREPETCRVKIKEINTQNKELHPLVTLLQYVQKVHGMNNLKKSVLKFDSITSSCIFTAIVSRTTPDMCQVIVYCGLSDYAYNDLRS